MMDAFELPPTLVQSLQRRAAQTPDQVALRFLAESAEHSVVLSYRDLDQRARTIAAALQANTHLGDRAVLRCVRRYADEHLARWRIGAARQLVAG